MTAASGTLRIAGPRPQRSRDAVALVLGDAEPPSTLIAALAVALAAHVLMLAFAIASGLLAEMRAAMREGRERLHDYYWRVYDVEVPKPAQKEEERMPEPPAPEPAPAVPQPKAVQPKEDDPYKNVAPTPSKAAAVLTQKEDPDQPVDLTGNTIVSGDGNVVGGQQSAQGKGDVRTNSRDASLQGVPGGQGKEPAPVQAPAVNRSRPIGLIGGNVWSCPFPPEAEAEGIDQAAVTVQVTVKPDGSALSAAVISDPGHGFGRQARICAMARRYEPALDFSGTPVLSSHPVTVRFSR